MDHEVWQDRVEYLQRVVSDTPAHQALNRAQEALSVGRDPTPDDMERVKALWSTHGDDEPESDPMDEDDED